MLVVNDFFGAAIPVIRELLLPVGSGNYSINVGSGLSLVTNISL